MIDYTKEMIKGADISSLYEIENLGAKFYDHGKQGDLIDILKSYGFNYIRLKLWNEPYDINPKTGEKIWYSAGNNDIETDVILAKRVKSKDMGLLLNFHYSDFWADPGKQNIPKAWRHLDFEGLKKAVYDFTFDSVNRLIEAGAKPDMIQIGNEITNGLLWPYGKKPWGEGLTEEYIEGQYKNIAELVSSGIRAVRKIDPSIPIMIHLDNGGNNPMYVDWFDHYMQYGDDFEIIGLSYYPFWHGKMADLSYNMRDLAERYGKTLVIDEVSMGFTMEDYAAYESLEPHERKGMATKPELVEKIEHEMTIEGQCRFMKDIMEEITKVPNDACRGFFYWEAGWLPIHGSEWANEAALAYTGEKGPGGNEWANQALFDYEGNALPALEVIRDFRVR